MNNIELVLKNFPENVKNHELTNLQESGLTRSFRVMNKTGSHNYHYDIVTWPGHIAISGDVGCFVFSRYGTEDMLKFFREYETLENLGYIEEKLVAHSKYGHREFCKDTLLDSLSEYCEMEDEENLYDTLTGLFYRCESSYDVAKTAIEYLGSSEFIGAVSGPHDAEDFEGNWFCVEVKSADGDYTPYDDNSYNGKEVWGTLLVGLSCRRWRNESRTRK